jgi:hypothetical protein
MDIQDLGAVGEFVSSLAIVVTLIFLTMETRNSRSTAQQNNRQARHRIRSDLNQALAVNPQLNEVLVKSMLHLSGKGGISGLAAQADEFGLSAPEFLQLNNYFLMFFRHLEDQYFSDVPDTDRAGLESQARSAIANAPFARFWEMSKQSFEHSFQVYIDGLNPRSPG